LAVKLSGTAALLAEAAALLRPHLPVDTALEAPPAASAPTPACALPVLAWLPALPALAAPDTGRLVELLVEAASSLAWRRTYAAGEVSPAFLARYGWAELLGPYGPLASHRLRLGFLLLGPDTLYRPHAHAAEELYLVLAGTAAWQHGQEPWQDRPPGTAIHHPPRLPHATRTAAEPLLALYLWWGADLNVHARLVRSHAVPEELCPSAQTDPEPDP
jgi:mannose-6-phosphate isomerase-like protein (cupin superfamily)